MIFGKSDNARNMQYSTLVNIYHRNYDAIFNKMNRFYGCYRSIWLVGSVVCVACTPCIFPYQFDRFGIRLRCWTSFHLNTQVHLYLIVQMRIAKIDLKNAIQFVSLSRFGFASNEIKFAKFCYEQFHDWNGQVPLLHIEIKMESNVCVCVCQFTWLNFYAKCFSGTWLLVNIICLPFCQHTHAHTHPCRLSILIVVHVTNIFQNARFHQLKFRMSIKLIRFSSKLCWLCRHAHVFAHPKPNNLKL